MLRQVALHNPALMSEEELNATFTGREDLLDGVLRGLREQAPKPVNQSLLLVGPRGIGKTNFIHMVRNRVLADDDLRAAYVPLLFPEEVYSMTSARDLFCGILRLLVEETHSEAATEAWERVRDDTDDERARETAIDALRDYHAASGRKLLACIENFDLLLGDQITDHTDVGRLRDVLMNEAFLALIATSPTHFRQVSGYDQPLYEFFRVIDLEDLSETEAEYLLRQRAEFEGNQDFLSRFDGYRRRLPAIRHLTGGNPRLILMLYTVFCQTALMEVEGALEALLDELTPYYKARIERLSPQQRKVLDAFAREGRPLTPTEIGKATGISAAQASAVLARLQEAGFVHLAEQRRRKRRLYVVSERMFRIWHQMRMSSAGRRRMQYFIEFISLWYSAQEARTEADHLLAAMRTYVTEGHTSLASRTAEHLGYLAAGVADSDAAFTIADDTIAACIEGGQCEEADTLINESLARAETEGDVSRVAWAVTWRALLHLQQGRLTQAVRDADLWLQSGLDTSWAHVVRAEALRRIAATSASAEKFSLLEQVCSEYDDALQGMPGDEQRPAASELESQVLMLQNWAVTLLMMGPTGDPEGSRRLAERACGKLQEAARIAPPSGRALDVWGMALHGMAACSTNPGAAGPLATACAEYRAALSAGPAPPQALLHLSAAFGRLASIAEGPVACDAARTAVRTAEEALRLVAAVPDGDLKACRREFGIALAARVTVGLRAGDLDVAQRAFCQALSSDLAAPEVRLHLLAALVLTAFTPTTIPFFRWLTDLLRERGLPEGPGVRALLEPPLTYWERDRDEGVLERLNPEVREIVEEIIERGEERDQAKAEGIEDES